LKLENKIEVKEGGREGERERAMAHKKDG